MLILATNSTLLIIAGYNYFEGIKCLQFLLMNLHMPYIEGNFRGAKYSWLKVKQ